MRSTGAWWDYFTILIFSPDMCNIKNKMFFYADDENKSGQGSGQKDPALSEGCNMTVECAYNGKETLQRRYHAAFDEDVRRSLSGGMNGHLPKPVNVRKLEELLFEFLG